VPLPYRIPVTVVDKVNAGVVPPLEVPANPFDEFTVNEVTGAVPLDAAVTKPFAFTVMDAFVYDPTLLFTVANVAAADPGPEAVTSPVKAVI